MSVELEPVKNPKDFFGQRSIVRRIFSRIGAERPQSIAIIGGRKVGKTSLLNYLTNPQIYQEFLPENAANYILIYEKIENNKKTDAKYFINLLLQKLLVTKQNLETEYQALQRCVEEFHQKAKHLIFIFDDFHYITRNPAFPLEFFSFLRSLANNFNVAFVTSSFLELQKLCIAKDIEESPFFNIFTNLSLGLIEINEAIDLLVNLTDWPIEQASKIINWIGPHPYLIKLIVMKVKNIISELNSLEKILMPILKDYFTEIVSVLPKEAFKPFKELANNRTVEEKDTYYLKPLVRHQFLLEEENCYKFFSEAFRLFVKAELKPDMLKKENNLYLN